jgi:hypothetical protein
MNVGARLDKITCIMALAFVLHATSTLVELQVGELDHVERIGHLRGLGHGLGKDAAVGTGEIEGRVAHVAEPLLDALEQLLRGGGPTSTRHDVEELTVSDVDNGRREDQASVGAVAQEQDLVESERRDDAEAVLVVINQGLAVAQEGVVHGVPVTTEFVGDLFHAAPVLANLLGEPATRAVGDEEAGKANAGVDFAPGPRGTVRVGAEEPALVLHDPTAFEVDGDEFTVAALNAQDVHVKQIDQEFAHAGRVCFHGGSSNLSASTTNRLAEPPPFFRPVSVPWFQ